MNATPVSQTSTVTCESCGASASQGLEIRAYGPNYAVLACVDTRGCDQRVEAAHQALRDAGNIYQRREDY